MHDKYPICTPTGTPPTKFVPTANLANKTVILSNANDSFEILTNKPVTTLMYMGLYTPKIPVCSVDDMMQDTVMQIIEADGDTQVVTKMMNTSLVLDLRLCRCASYP